MKLRLLKPLPGAEVGAVSFGNDIRKAQFGELYYECETLISTGWAEEIKEPELWEPKLGETYYKYAIYTEHCHPIAECKSFESVGAEKKMAEYGLVAKTREELETTLLLLKLRQSNGGWKPDKLKAYFMYRSDIREVVEETNNAMMYDMLSIFIGNCYRTREEAEKYAPEWNKLFDSVK